MSVIGGDQQSVVVIESIDEVSELAIDFLMYCQHRLGRRTVRPVSQCITQHLMRDFIDSRLVEQHEVSRMTRQGLNCHFPEKPSHAARQYLEGGQRKAWSFPY